MPKRPPQRQQPRKKPSGAQNRKAKRLREEAARRAAAGRPEALPETWLAGYSQLGAPPPDTVSRIEWANHACALLLHETLNDPGIEPNERRRVGAELIRTLGMTSVKALYEERLKKLEAKVYGRGRAKGGDHGASQLDPFVKDPPPRSA